MGAKKVVGDVEGFRRPSLEAGTVPYPPHVLPYNVTSLILLPETLGEMMLPGEKRKHFSVEV